MGSDLKINGLYRVLALGPEGSKDLPARVKVTGQLVQRLNHPTVMSALSYGSSLCKQYGFFTKNEKDVKFADELGRALRRIAAFYVFRNEARGELHRAAKATFLLLLEKWFPQDFAKVRNEMQWITQDEVNYASFLLDALTLKKPEKKKKETKENQAHAQSCP